MRSIQANWSTTCGYTVYVVPQQRQQPDRGSLLESPTHEEQSQPAKKQSPEKEHTQTTNLTRFGLNAYVLGAIRRVYLEEDYNG